MVNKVAGVWRRPFYRVETKKRLLIAGSKRPLVGSEDPLSFEGLSWEISDEVTRKRARLPTGYRVSYVGLSGTQGTGAVFSFLQWAQKNNQVGHYELSLRAVVLNCNSVGLKCVTLRLCFTSTGTTYVYDHTISHF